MDGFERIVSILHKSDHVGYIENNCVFKITNSKSVAWLKEHSVVT